MIHAYMFLKCPMECQVDEGHGPRFKELMRNINSITGLNITVYHNFHDEVNFYRKHVWRCNGKCREKAPFYGYVRRSNNRKPQPADLWFAKHSR